MEGTLPLLYTEDETCMITAHILEVPGASLSERKATSLRIRHKSATGAIVFRHEQISSETGVK